DFYSHTLNTKSYFNMEGDTTIWQIIRIIRVTSAVLCSPCSPRSLPGDAAAGKWTAARIRMTIFLLICQSAWLMFPGRNGRISMIRTKVWKAELFLKNWINRSWVKEVYADE